MFCNSLMCSALKTSTYGSPMVPHQMRRIPISLIRRTFSSSMSAQKNERKKPIEAAGAIQNIAALQKEVIALKKDMVEMKIALNILTTSVLLGFAVLYKH
jgi:hypothetical protein